MTYIWVGELTLNGFLPGRCQAIICINAGILLIWPLGTKVSEFLIEIKAFSCKTIHLKISCRKCCPFRLGPNVWNNAPLYSFSDLNGPPKQQVSNVHSNFLACRFHKLCGWVIGYVFRITYKCSGAVTKVFRSSYKSLISTFRHFLQPLFQNDQGWPIIPNFSLLTWYMVINRYVRLQNCFLWHVWRSICSLDIVDYVAPIIFVATINGYVWHLSWIFVFLLKSSKLFVTNLSTIFILGIFIYHKQLYESSRLLVLARLRHY